MGLPNYGDCFWVLKELMIAHRASVFEENTVVFMERRKIKVSGVHKLPPGYRATREERARLSVAKLAARIDAATPPEAFAELEEELLRGGVDEHIENVLYGHPLPESADMPGAQAQARAAGAREVGVVLEHFWARQGVGAPEGLESKARG